MDFGERLRAKVGPLPVWAWGLIAGGLFTVWYWVSQRDTGTASGSDTGTEEGTVETPSGDFSTVPIVPPGDAVEDENTNQEWLIQALNKASEAGVSFVTAQVALSKYLNGQTLTATEESIVNRVIGLVGPPPEGTFGVPEVVPDTPAPTTPTQDFSTTTSLSVASSARYGGSLPVRVSVKWNQRSGKSSPTPTGYAVFTVGKKTYRKRLIAGQSVAVFGVKKGDDRLTGNRLVISARFEPPASATKTKGSSAPPKTVLYK